MKKINLNKKLQLNKEIIANLNNDKMNQIKGGNYSIGCPANVVPSRYCANVVVDTFVPDSLKGE